MRENGKEIVASKQQGVALLAVLWLVVALSAMAMALSYLARTEIEAAGNQIEAQRSYYLARGGMEAAVYSLTRSAMPSSLLASTAPGEQFLPGQRWLRFDFPGGTSWVEVSPENAKLNVNLASPEQLTALFEALGLPAAESLELAEAIVNWRSPRASDVATAGDLFYASLPEPYPARHAPLEQLEELLPVKGMSRELFYGRLEKTPEGQWRRRPSLADLLTTENTFGMVNPNYAAPEVLQALFGWDPILAGAVVQARMRGPFASLTELQAAVPALPLDTAATPLTFSVGPVYTLTATGLLPDSAVRRSARALVQVGADLPLSHRVLAWWDDWPWSSEPPVGTELSENAERNRL